MGSGVSKALGFRKPEIMNVDPIVEVDKRTHTFSRTMFKKMEWEVMKAFCQKYKIKQADLIIVFQRYLTHDEVYIREFKVRTKDPKMLYLRESRLQQELAEILIPSFYMKSFAGLEVMDSTEEVSFARFIVMSYIFGLQQFPDLLYDFFSIVRRKMDLQLSVVFSACSIKEICLLMIEDLKPSGGVLLIKMALQKLDQAPDFRLKTILRIGTKYPLLFWALQKFRRCYKRFVFGDRFWSRRKCLKLKSLEILDFPSDFNDWFVNEVTAIRFTAMHMISDIVTSNAKEWTFGDIYNPPLLNINYEQITKLKEVVGYKIATKLLIESEIPYDFDPIFASPFIHHDNPTNLAEQGLEEINREENTVVAPAETYGVEKEGSITMEESADIPDSNEDEKEQEQEDDENGFHDDEAEVDEGGDFQHDQVDVGVIMHDETFDREFAYDIHSGRSRWAKIVMNAAGQTLVYKFE